MDRAEFDAMIREQAQIFQEQKSWDPAKFEATLQEQARKILHEKTQELVALRFALAKSSISQPIAGRTRQTANFPNLRRLCLGPGELDLDSVESDLHGPLLRFLPTDEEQAKIRADILREGREAKAKAARSKIQKKAKIKKSEEEFEVGGGADGSGADAIGGGMFRGDEVME